MLAAVHDCAMAELHGRAVCVCRVTHDAGMRRVQCVARVCQHVGMQGDMGTQAGVGVLGDAGVQAAACGCGRALRGHTPAPRPSSQSVAALNRSGGCIHWRVMDNSQSRPCKLAYCHSTY